jgi:pyruvate dehydrogenase E1 component alpha subunit
MPGVTVDGTDIFAVYEVAEQAVQRARSGQGPTLIECKTHRWRLHAEQRGNPTDPRPRDEVERAQQQDPLLLMSARLQSQGVATDEALRRIENEVRQAVENAVEFAKSSPLPRPEDALLDVFAS